MCQFKVGDKVKILDGAEITDYTGGWTPDMKAYVGEIREITDIEKNLYDNGIYCKLDKSGYRWDIRGLQLLEKSNNKEDNIMKNIPNIVNYKYTEDTAVTTIEWSDGTKTTVRAEYPETASPYTGFVTACAKKAFGNNNTINKLFDEWAVKKPARETKAKIKANAAELEAKRIAEKRRAKRENWFIRRRAAEIKREHEARKLAHEKYGVPMDEKESGSN